MQLKRAIVVLIAFGIWLPTAAPTFAEGDASKSENEASAPSAPSSEPMARHIDSVFEQAWNMAHVEPAPLASDGEFLRRAYLDLNGVIPRAAEVRAFMTDDRPDKRIVLVDKLLASPRYSTHMATIWRNRILPLGTDATRGPQAVALQKWLRTRFAKNLRYDNLVGELLLTLGGDELGPALYFQAHELSPEKLAASTAELFLGLQLHCAQCHDHPTADWKQRDFWGLAAFFARVQPANERNMMGMSYRLVDASQGDVRLPDSNEVIPPKFPGGDLASDEVRSRRVLLALWITSRDNEFFSRAAVNWAWSHLFGRGLVESLDDVHADSSKAILLSELAAYFEKSGYDLRNLWRTLAVTRVYQLSSRDPEPSTGQQQHFALMTAKPLTPEQLYDSFSILAPLGRAGAQSPEAAQPFNVPASLAENPLRTEFIRRMRPPPGSATEYRAGTLQALMMMNGRTMAQITAAGESTLLGALDAPFMNDEDRIDSLFLATLAREPDGDESQACLATLADCKDAVQRNRALSDVLWALLNSTEFAFNQ